MFGMAIGIAAAYFRRRWPDRFASGLITTAQSIPDFFLGLLLILVFYSIWRVAPAPVGILDPGKLSGGQRVSGSIVVDAVITGSWATVASIGAHAILPALTIGFHFSSYFAKTVRTSMTQSMGSAQVEFARAHGLPERKVLGYALITARTPVLTYSAILFGSLLGASAIVETIFAWPGVGQWALAGTLQADIPVIQGFVLLIGLLTMVVYLALDLSVLLLDPRVRSEQ
jgi:peptide/nickel transport system permease protein